MHRMRKKTDLRECCESLFVHLLHNFHFLDQLLQDRRRQALRHLGGGDSQHAHVRHGAAAHRVPHTRGRTRCKGERTGHGAFAVVDGGG